MEFDEAAFGAERELEITRDESCERCKGKLEKLISRTAFQLKGGGWYAHGYDSKSANTSPV